MPAQRSIRALAFLAFLVVRGPRFAVAECLAVY